MSSGMAMKLRAVLYRLSYLSVFVAASCSWVIFLTKAPPLCDGNCGMSLLRDVSEFFRVVVGSNDDDLDVDVSVGRLVAVLGVSVCLLVVSACLLGVSVCLLVVSTCLLRVSVCLLVVSACLPGVSVMLGGRASFIGSCGRGLCDARDRSDTDSAQ